MFSEACFALGIVFSRIVRVVLWVWLALCEGPGPRVNVGTAASRCLPGCACAKVRDTACAATDGSPAAGANTGMDVDANRSHTPARSVGGMLLLKDRVVLL